MSDAEHKALAFVAEAALERLKGMHAAIVIVQNSSGQFALVPNAAPAAVHTLLKTALEEVERLIREHATDAAAKRRRAHLRVVQGGRKP